MKKFKYLLFTLAMILFLPISVFASGGISPSPRSLTITKGGTATFTITASNAVGRVDISSSNGSVATVNKSSEWLENSSTTVTVTGVSAGTTTINVRLSDAATFDEEELSGNYTVSVTVKDPAPVNNNNNNTNNNTNNKPSNNNNNKPSNNTNNTTDNRSKNNNVEGLSISGHELKKIDDHNYELTVNNNVSNITIEGKAQDSKAKIEGIGNKELKEGLNTFEVVITAENGSQNKINIKVTRKDGYYLNDLDAVLNDKTLNNIGIIVNNDGKITENDLKAIKDSKKTISFDFYNEEKKLMYSWIIDGSKINDTSEFNSNVSFNSELVKEISFASNYADGKYIHFEHSGKLPKGTKIKLYVGDKFEDGNLVNVYYYNKNDKELESIKKELNVKDGYVEFDIEHCSEYFITRSNLGSIQSNNYLIGIIAIVELIIIIAIIVLDILKINPLLKLKKDTTKKTSKQ